MYSAHANAYVPKPLDWDRFTAAVQHVAAFYFEIAGCLHLPPEPPEASSRSEG
jgi:hypothetical protein